MDITSIEKALDYRSEDQKIFEQRLRDIAAQIHTAAAGKICGECKAYRDGWCAKHLNVHGDALSIWYRTAPACPSFERRRGRPRKLPVVA